MQPVAPMWNFKVMKPIMTGLLRSRLHSLISRSLMLITYTGRTTGKQYTFPTTSRIACCPPAANRPTEQP